MTIDFYSYKGESNKWTKTLASPSTLTGALRDSADLINPTILVEFIPEEGQADLFPFNYCYITEFARYYFVRNITIERTHLFRLSLEEDFIQSWKEEIKNDNAYVERIGKKASRNVYVNDPCIPTGLHSYTNRATLTLSGGAVPFVPSGPTQNCIAVTIADNDLRIISRASTPGSERPAHLPLITDNDTIYDNNLTNKTYLITITKLQDLMNWMMSEDISDYMENYQAYFQSSANMIISAIKFPFDLKAHDTHGAYDDTFSIGGHHVPSMTNYYLASSAYDNVIDVGDVTYTRQFNDYRDFEPYSTYQIYLPYYGFVDLDSSDVIGNNIGVKYIFSLQTGDATAVIYKNSGSNGKIIKYVPFQLGQKLEITTNDANSVEQQKAQTGISIALKTVSAGVQAYTGNYGGFVASVGGIISDANNMMTNQPHNRGGANACQHLEYAEQQAYIMAKHQFTFGVDDIATFKGYSYYHVKTPAQLVSDNAGLCFISNMHFDDCGATMDERDSLLAIMKNGVIF